MTHTTGWRVVAIVVFASLGLVEARSADTPPPDADWPQFHGPRRDNLSRETGLLRHWPEGGPRLLWKALGIGHGFATVAIASGRLYTAGDKGKDTLVTALDMDGKTLWQAKGGTAFKRTPRGARATPTFNGGRLYCHSGEGDVACLDAKTGALRWTRNVQEDFGGRNIQWGLSESLLVDGERVLCTPGGEDITMAALNKETGETAWTCTGLGDKPSYTTPILIEHGGLLHIDSLTANRAVGVAPDTGKLLWKHEHKVASEANCVTPICHDGHIALAGTWGRGAMLLKLTVQGEDCAVEEVWRTKELDNEHGGIVLVDGCLYGQADGDHKKRHWACLDFKTGKTLWTADGLPGRTGTTSYADGMLYMMNDRRAVALAPPSPKGLEVVSRFELPKGGRGPTWAHLVIHGGRLYIRHGDFLYAYDVRAEAP